MHRLSSALLLLSLLSAPALSRDFDQDEALELARSGQIMAREGRLQTALGE